MITEADISRKRVLPKLITAGRDTSPDHIRQAKDVCRRLRFAGGQQSLSSTAKTSRLPKVASARFDYRGCGG